MAQSERIFTQASEIRCIKCGLWKPRTDFYESLLSERHYCCRVCWCAHMRGYKKEHRAQFSEIERRYYHRIQDEAGCHLRPRVFFPGYRFLLTLQDAPVVEV